MMPTPDSPAGVSPKSIVFGDPSKPLLLDSFRQDLIRQEETIIFALIERAQFGSNPRVYAKDSRRVFGDSTEHCEAGLSFLDFMHRETEKLHGAVRRFTQPDENPFYPESLPPPLLPALDFPTVLRPNSININEKIRNVYLSQILPAISSEGDDKQYGSTATCDIAVLQALSKRIHFGKYIAEAKFQAEPERYTALIKANDAQGIMAALTNRPVEERVLQRVTLKTSTYGQDIHETIERSDPTNLKVNPDAIAQLYDEFVMPLTKDVQVQYLLQRVCHPEVAVAGSNGGAAYQAAIAHFGVEAIPNLVLPPGYVVSTGGGGGGTATATVIGGTATSGAAMSVSVYDPAVPPPPPPVETEGPCSGAGRTDVRTLTWAVEQVAGCHAAYAILPLEHASTGVLSPAIEALLASAGAVFVCAEVVLPAEVTAACAGRGSVAAAAAGGGVGSRFIVVCKGAPRPSGRDKSLFVIALADHCGALSAATQALGGCGVNLRNLHMLPRRSVQDIRFFVEAQGHISAPPLDTAMAELSRVCVAVTPLGSVQDSVVQ